MRTYDALRSVELDESEDMGGLLVKRRSDGRKSELLQ